MTTKHEIIARRKIDAKLQRVVDTWSPTQNQDRSWMKWAKCKLCHERYVCNNYEDRKVRSLRLCGVAVCAHCYYMRGSEQLAKMYKLTKALAGCTTKVPGSLVREAREILGDTDPMRTLEEKATWRPGDPGTALTYNKRMES